MDKFDLYLQARKEFLSSFGIENDLDEHPIEDNREYIYTVRNNHDVIFVLEKDYNKIDTASLQSRDHETLAITQLYECNYYQENICTRWVKSGVETCEEVKTAGGYDLIQMYCTQHEDEEAYCIFDNLKRLH